MSTDCDLEKIIEDSITLLDGMVNYGVLYLQFLEQLLLEKESQNMLLSSITL